MKSSTEVGGTETALRVLFVESATEMGGAQLALLTMLRHLDRQRIAPLFASLEFGRGDFPERVQQLGITVFRLAGGRFRDLRSTARQWRQLAGIIRQHRVEVVVCNSGHPLLYARPAAIWTGRPCVWWVHIYSPRDALRGDLLAWAQQFLWADQVLANSEHTARLLAQDFPERRPARVVHCGIDLQQHAFRAEERQRARHELGAGDGTAVVGIFGRLQPWKGQHVFLQAASLLKKQNVECRFLVVGGALFGLNADYPGQLREMSTRLGLNGEVAFLGQRADVNRLMNACDVVVHASTEPEPWGLVVAEGMAAGRAVIASDEGGPREMIAQGRTGMLIPPRDPGRLAEAIADLVENPEMRQQLGQAARQHAERNFGAREAAARFCDALREVAREFTGRA